MPGDNNSQDADRLAPVGGSAADHPLRREDIARVLAATTLFSTLDDATLARLAGQCGQRYVKRGQFLVYQGDPGDRIFIIAEGLAKIVLSSEHGDELVFATVGRNDSLGELAVLDGSSRSASVVAVEPTRVVMLSRATLIQIMTEHPAVLDALMRSLGALVRHLTELTGDFVFLDLGGRLAKVLLRLSRAHGAGPDGAMIDLRLSQSDLAAMVGASRPAVNRALQLLAGRGWISLDGQVIVLRDLDALRRRCAD
jgi:CRP/FNR family transcriptional regulator, cyclic AMP receptor protein